MGGWIGSNLESLKEEEGHTFAFVSDAHSCFLKFQARSSSILCFLNDLSSSCLGSVAAASHTAFAPRLPIANFAVNWKSPVSED